MSTTQHRRLHELLPARPDSVAQLRRAVTSYAGREGASERQREDIALAVSEALSNVVIHAYVGAERPGDVGVRAWVAQDRLQVVVCDEGSGMVPRTDSPGAGLGLALMGKVAEQVRVESGDGGSGMRVRMTFQIG